MPIITSTAGNVNMGRDIQISLTPPPAAEGVGGFQGAGGGTAIVLTNIMMFTYDQETIDIKKTKIDSRTINAFIPQDWKGTIEFERASDDIDVMIANIENFWYQNGVYNLGSMSVTVANPSPLTFGNTEDGFTMDFQDVAVRLESGGEFKGDDTVRVRLAWRAAARNT